MRDTTTLRLFSTSLCLLSFVAFAATGSVRAEETVESSHTSSMTTQSETAESEPKNTAERLSEKEQSLEAGYTVQQFDQIMSIPKLGAVSIPSISRATGQQNSVVSNAKAQIGKPYSWGASGPNAFDCGGLVKYVYKQAVNVDLQWGRSIKKSMGKKQV
ncbi:NlpC/P60 family protein [Enterococcus raffinosus]|uniref:NlpC/P60 family protein n=1 Tax=Enterococcus raffinosus TaxID=71452 RepID=A0AAW8SVB4_9ENTE|nr:NlpC/P60 family protein [Enterococcus raffinosus]MDK7992207.1 NlpC/P60 family protein [Enterococcus raffinosus]MDT2536545.1 NlpC/P60 family protein [Enterococcus raffinosus]